MNSMNNGFFATNHIRFVLSIATPYAHYGIAIAMNIEVECRSFKLMTL
jgi:hypothetical protein